MTKQVYGVTKPVLWSRTFFSTALAPAPAPAPKPIFQKTAPGSQRKIFIHGKGEDYRTQMDL